MSDEKPPKDYIYRALMPGPSVRSEDDSEQPTQMVGHFAVFDQWTEINSMWEGHFLERIAPGAFQRTFDQKRDAIKVTLNHGHDPELGDKPLGAITELAEDDTGARYAVDLLPSVPPLVREGLAAGLYGSSFRFRVTREEFAEKPERSDYNPDGIPERTIKEVELYEFGPVTFPAYASATAGVRSMTDEVLMERFTTGEGLKRLSEFVESRKAQEDPPTPAQTTSAPATEDKPASLPRHQEWIRLRAERRMKSNA